MASISGDLRDARSYIWGMESVLPFLIAGAMALTVIVLFAGIISFGVASKVDTKYATRLMAARVAFQGVAIALFGLMTFLAMG